jgi:hypothetical protein
MSTLRVSRLLRLPALLLAGALFYYALALRFWFQVLYVTEQEVVISFPFHLRLPLVLLWLLPLLVAVLFIALSRTGRTVLAAIRTSRAHLLTVLAALAALLFTLYPQKFDGKVTISFLSLAGTGFLFLLYALEPLLVRTARWLDAAGNLLFRRTRPLTFVLVLAGFTLLLANVISALVFRHIPHVMDSIGQVFQARVFAAGRAWLPAKWDDWFFSFVSILNDGNRVYEISPPGHSLLLALGTLAHAEWLVNPLLGALTVIVLYLLGREVYDEPTGRLTALLGTVSPFLIFMSSEYMNHASALLFLSLFLLFFFRTIRDLRPPAREFTGTDNSVASVVSLRPLRSVQTASPARRFLDPLIAGCALGYAMNVRPLAALAIAVPVAAYGVYLLVQRRGQGLGRFLVMLAPVLLGLAGFFLHNYLVTGDPLLPGYKAYGILEFHHTRWGLGFGLRGYEWWGSLTPLRSLVQTGNNLNSLNENLFGGALPGLVFIVLLLLAFTRNPADYVLLAACVSLPAAYFFYWFQDLCFGPRFLYESLGPLLVLSARGVVEFPRFLGRLRGPETQSRSRNAMRWVLILSVLSTLGLGLPHLLRIYARNYWGVNDNVHAEVKRRNITNAVVFVNSLFPYFGKSWDSYYGAGFLHNTLDFAGPVVYARDRGVQNYALMRLFPGRRYYYADANRFYEIVSPDSLRRAPQIQGLLQADALIRSLDRREYRSLLLPFREADVLVPSSRLPVATYRELSNELFLGRSDFDRHLPALAVFLADDQRRYLGLFEFMRGSEFGLHGYEIAEPADFVQRLRAATDPVSRYLRDRLSRETRSWLDNLHGEVTTEFKAVLVRDISNLLADSVLYDTARFAHIPLTPEIQDLLSRQPAGHQLGRLNRLLLDNAYPDELAPLRPEAPNFVTGGYRFTRLFRSDWEDCLVYDIRPATGDENVVNPLDESEP